MNAPHAPSGPLTGLFQPPPRGLVVQDLVARARARLAALPPREREVLWEDALFHERKRLERQPAAEGEEARLDALARALVKGDDQERADVGLGLVAGWVEEIHGRFSRPAYRFATTAFPPALAALLSGRPARVTDWNLDVTKRVEVHGDTALLRQLAREATLILAPTHVSNLDSPIIGLALTLAGLPPFQYGAGLNLFSNPVLGWWMRRLGAYTVDRTKQAALYKDVLKDYSVYMLARRHHSLFFPGGTRARSGALEQHLKKGLLGTGVAAWQELLRADRPDADVYVVPMTLSYSQVLEASTLIEDFLAEAGRQRYIITDDEFAQPRRIAAFVRRILSLDASITCRFGHPLDVLGHPVPADPGERAAASERRRGYVCDRDGRVQADPQRDRVYTERLADALVQAYPRDATVMTTHLVARVAWLLLARALGTGDPFRLVRSPRERRRLPRAGVLAALAAARAEVVRGAEAGRWHHALPDDVEALLADAVDRFGRYHRTRALADRGDALVVEDPKLCLYYGNRARFAVPELP